MTKFPRDAPIAKVLKALGALGFEIIREGNHIWKIARAEIGRQKSSLSEFGLSNSYDAGKTGCRDIKG